MSYSIEDLEAIAKKLRYDLTAMQVKVTDLLNGLSDISAAMPVKKEGTHCPRCDLTFYSEERVVEHLENVHGVLT